MKAAEVGIVARALSRINHVLTSALDGDGGTTSHQRYCIADEDIDPSHLPSFVTLAGGITPSMY